MSATERRSSEGSGTGLPTETTSPTCRRIAAGSRSRRRRPIGTVPIPVASIAGTVDWHKGRHVRLLLPATGFQPRPRTLMYRAVRRGTQLPPVSVYRVGTQHFVRDGHYRASVARAMGADSIDAVVVELLRSGVAEP